MLKNDYWGRIGLYQDDFYDSLSTAYTLRATPLPFRTLPSAMSYMLEPLGDILREISIKI